MRQFGDAKKHLHICNLRRTVKARLVRYAGIVVVRDQLPGFVAKAAGWTDHRLGQVEPCAGIRLVGLLRPWVLEHAAGALALFAAAADRFGCGGNALGGGFVGRTV